MKKASLEEMTKGWFIGRFKPCVFDTDDMEIAVKRYKKGEREETHHHRVATEITTIVSGSVLMNKVTYRQDDIVVIEPYDATNFMALEDAITVVVKIPGELNDKYDGEYIA